MLSLSDEELITQCQTALDDKKQSKGGLSSEPAQLEAAEPVELGPHQRASQRATNTGTDDELAVPIDSLLVRSQAAESSRVSRGGSERQDSLHSATLARQQPSSAIPSASLLLGAGDKETTELAAAEKDVGIAAEADPRPAAAAAAAEDAAPTDFCRSMLADLLGDLPSIGLSTAAPSAPLHNNSEAAHVSQHTNGAAEASQMLLGSNQEESGKDVPTGSLGAVHATKMEMNSGHGISLSGMLTGSGGLDTVVPEAAASNPKVSQEAPLPSGIVTATESAEGYSWQAPQKAKKPSLRERMKMLRGQ